MPQNQDTFRPLGTLKDRVPPHNLDAEEATLGALLLDWNAVTTVLPYLRADRFYSRRNQLIFEAIISLFNKGQTGDSMVLVEELRAAGTLEAAGGEAYIAELSDAVPTAANVEYYAQLVLDAAVRRELIKAASHITQEAQDQTKTSRETLEEAQKRIFELTDLHNTTEIITMPTLVQATLSIIASHFDNKGALSGVPSGFSDLDNKTGGFQPQQLIIIGARPGMGKTAMALSMLEHIAVDKHIPAGFFSLEMPVEEIGQRLASQITGIASERIRNGFFPDGAWQSIHDAMDLLFDATLPIVDEPQIKMLELRALARNMVRNHGVKIIFVDYITYITPEDTRMQRYEQVGELSRSLKALARELKIPLVVLSQLGRPAEGKAPSLSDLRESGNIEQDADVALLIERERGDGTQEVIETKLHVAKQRNGPTGVVELLFKPGITKFVNKARG